MEGLILARVYRLSLRQRLSSLRGTPVLASKYIRLSYLMSAAVVECGTCRCVCLGRAAYCVPRHVHHIFVFKRLGFGYTGEFKYRNPRMSQ